MSLKITKKDLPLRVLKVDIEISLKLTESEWELFEGRYDEIKTFCQGTDLVLDVLDVDKFREFLKSMTINFTNCQELVNYNLANSILTKLDKEIM